MADKLTNNCVLNFEVPATQTVDFIKFSSALMSKIPYFISAEMNNYVEIEFKFDNFEEAGRKMDIFFSQIKALKISDATNNFRFTFDLFQI